MLEFFLRFLRRFQKSQGGQLLNTGLDYEVQMRGGDWLTQYPQNPWFSILPLFSSLAGLKE